MMHSVLEYAYYVCILCMHTMICIEYVLYTCVVCVLRIVHGTYAYIYYEVDSII
jgi:hypothetical protein